MVEEYNSSGYVCFDLGLDFSFFQEVNDDSIHLCLSIIVATQPSDSRSPFMQHDQHSCFSI